MATSNQLAATNSSGKNENTQRLFDRHKLKFLNLSLLLYLSLGAFVFDYLGDSSSPIKQQLSPQQQLSKQNDKTKPVNLNELRLSSVRRMWNITNQLNILYESNWTLLVLDELIKFEEKLIESIKTREDESDNEFEIDFGLDLEKDLSSSTSNENGDEELAKKREQQKRTKSIKKSIVHSLATITTIGTPDGAQPKGQLSKLMTIIYGSLGIPLLFVTVAQTGKGLAERGLNSMLVVRHYCFTLPSYYLCCSCSPYRCFKWLTWCCCCCCCCRYLFCLSDEKVSFKRKGPPQLRLRTFRVASRGARRMKQIRFGGSDGSAPYVIGSEEDKANNQQKSVRFMSQHQNQEGFELERATDNEAENGWFSFKSSSIFSTSLLLLVVYFLIGSYHYSKSHQSTLIDSMFDCFSMLSMSKLPESFNFAKKLDPINRYETLKVSLNKTTLNKLKESRIEATKSLLLDSFTWDLFYLILGINLVSMVAHFARLTYSNDEEDQEDETEAPTQCNGHIPSIMGPFDQNAASSFMSNGQTGPTGGAIGNLKSQQELTAAGFIIHPGISMDQQQSSGQTDLASSIQAQQLQQSGQPIGLTELYVVSQQESPIDQHFGFDPQQQQQKQTLQQPQTSDISFASDRSTGSLCLHHQQQANNRVKAELYGSSTLHRHPAHHHGHNRHKSMGHDNRLGSTQARIYLPDNSVMLNDDDDDCNEMDRMLKTCIKTPGSNQLIRSNSNSNQLAQAMQVNNSNGILQGATLNNTGRQVALMNGSFLCQNQNSNSIEQDNNSLNTTNSNTMSSVSSRTIKLPQQIGFIGLSNMEANQN